jgi:hypothetical protein
VHDISSQCYVMVSAHHLGREWLNDQFCKMRPAVHGFSFKRADIRLKDVFHHQYISFSHWAIGELVGRNNLDELPCTRSTDVDL